jgi:hypothetical protein
MKCLAGFVLLLSISGCMHYATINASKTSSANTALQDFYSPCCGSCGQRIIIDSLNGKQYGLLVNCKIENKYSAMCTPLRLGTQKHVLVYKKGKVISEAYYKPVYDTVELKRMFPGVQPGEYRDHELESKPMLALSAIDTLLIQKYYSMSKDTGCAGNHLRLIKGFICASERSGSEAYNEKASFKVK